MFRGAGPVVVQSVRIVSLEPDFVEVELVCWHRAVLVIPCVLGIPCGFVRQLEIVVNPAGMSSDVVWPSDLHIRKVASEHALLLGSRIVEELVDLVHDVWATVSVGFLQNPDERTLRVRVSVGVESLLNADVGWWYGLGSVFLGRAVAVRVHSRECLQDVFDLQLASNGLYSNPDDHSLAVSEDVRVQLSIVVFSLNDRAGQGQDTRSLFRVPVRVNEVV